MEYIGIDVHKNVSTVCVLDADGSVKNELIDIETTEEGYQALLEITETCSCTILIENSTRSHFVYHFLKGKGYDITVAHSADLKTIGNSKVKNDRIDAKKLAEYAMRRHHGETQFSVCNMTDPENMMLKSLCRLNASLIRTRADTVRRIREYVSMQNIMMPPGYVSVRSRRAIKFLDGLGDPVLANMMSFVRDLNARIEETEYGIEHIAVSDEDMALLMTIPGVGIKTAATVMTAIDCIGRFDSPDKLVSYFGADPVTDESAGKRKRGHVSKEGDAMVRYILRNAVIAHVYRFMDTDLSIFFHRLKGRMEHGKALMAAVRKMICIMWAMLTHRETFRSHPSS